VLEVIAVEKYQRFDPLQWVKVYGVVSSRCDYIITCQGYQLETVLGCLQPGWWDDVILEADDQEEELITV
jgi:hypothetical protein